MNTIVLGIGNEWASDDGVGPEVVRRLQDRWQEQDWDPKQTVEFSVIARPDLSLLDRIVGYTNLIIVDAVVSDQPPGIVHHEMWEPGVLEARGVQRASSHGFGVRELLEMAEVMGKLPERVECGGLRSLRPNRGRACHRRWRGQWREWWWRWRRRSGWVQRRGLSENQKLHSIYILIIVHLIDKRTLFASYIASNCRVRG